MGEAVAPAPARPAAAPAAALDGVDVAPPALLPAAAAHTAAPLVTASGAEMLSPSAPLALAPVAPHWLVDLERESRTMLQAGQPDVWDTLTRKFEAQLIHTALEITRGRRIEAAQKLGIGRNTITRKIQELGLED
jgi:two-component system nitrogen regulation response regulator GlnG